MHKPWTGKLAAVERNRSRDEPTEELEVYDDMSCIFEELKVGKYILVNCLDTILN